jgi:hypothetical protein
MVSGASCFDHEKTLGAKLLSMSSASTSLLRQIELDVDGSAAQPVPNLTLGCVLTAKLKHGLHLGIS